MTHVWLAQDPESGRITAQAHEWQDGDFPPGPRGQGWRRRQLDVDDEVWRDVLSGKTSPNKQDELHLQWWAEA